MTDKQWYVPNAWYRNEYYCDECDMAWEDEWSCMCNDRCPSCDAEIEPVKSKEISKEVNWNAWKQVDNTFDTK